MFRSHLVLAWALTACSTAEPFALEFAAMHDGTRFDCASPAADLGPQDAYTAHLADLRFYVSGLRLLDGDEEAVQHTLDKDAFQLDHPSGAVVLIDLTAAGSGACAPEGITFSEGTARTHTAVTGTALLDDVSSVQFDVGVPQAVMASVIADHTLEGAPSPLGEMYWSWASGYRHFVMNLGVESETESGEGYVHVGSRDCSAEGENALESRDACGFLNTPRVKLDLDLRSDVIELDVGPLLDALDFRTPVYDPETFEVVGEQMGVACHSAPTQPHCGPIFDALGLDDAGAASATQNSVFSVR